MSEVVIEAQRLSKSYRVGHPAPRERYTALRDVWARHARGLCDLLRGNRRMQREQSEDKSLMFPDFDMYGEPLPETFDLIFEEQVLEHLLWPNRAGRNVYEMLNPGGSFLVVHDYPVDCSR